MIRGLFLDQNIAPETADFLRELGFYVTSTRELGMARATDDQIARFAATENLIVLTFNGDFGDIREYPPGSYPGVIRLRVYPQTIETLHPVLQNFFDRVDLNDIERALVILDNNRYRIRR